MDTAAWTSLSDRSIWLYLELRKQFRYDQGGDSHLVLPYSKVAWRMSKGTYFRHMKELGQYGFIDVIELGGLPHRPTVYALSTRWKGKDLNKEIVGKSGREAIKLGWVKKPGSRDSLKNLIGKRKWEKKK
jgi:hypothetical protein